MDGGREKSTGVVTHQYLKEGNYEIEIDGKLWPANIIHNFMTPRTWL